MLPCAAHQISWAASKCHFIELPHDRHIISFYGINDAFHEQAKIALPKQEHAQDIGAAMHVIGILELFVHDI